VFWSSSSNKAVGVDISGPMLVNPKKDRSVSPPPAREKQQGGWGSKPARESPSGMVQWGVDSSDPRRREEEEERKQEIEKKKAQERKEKDKEFAKKEEQYIRTGENVKQMEAYKRRKAYQSFLAKQIDHVNCHCQLDVTAFEIRNKNGKPEYVVYRVDITYDEFEWAIFRRWGQFDDLDTMFKREVRGYTDCMPKIEKQKNKYDSEYLEQRRRGLHEYLYVCSSSRTAIFTSKLAGASFIRFLAPIQYGDEKPPGFVMPFKVEI